MDTNEQVKIMLLLESKGFEKTDSGADFMEFEKDTPSGKIMLEINSFDESIYLEACRPNETKKVDSFIGVKKLADYLESAF